jgi:PTH1 family peptidyl-tRNA hydrolase
MWMLVGLGNPGARYLNTRHNIGFMLIDALASEWGASFKEEHRALVARLSLKQKNNTHELLLVKPQTFMNLSGQAVQSLMTYYKVDKPNILVIHDEVDQPFGNLKLQFDRGSGGHNGIKDIHERIGSDYARLRLGVGRPVNPRMRVADFVLQNFSHEEFEAMPDFLSRGMDSVEVFINEPFSKALTIVNSELSQERHLKP